MVPTMSHYPLTTVFNIEAKKADFQRRPRWRSPLSLSQFTSALLPPSIQPALIVPCSAIPSHRFLQSPCLSLSQRSSVWSSASKAFSCCSGPRSQWQRLRHPRGEPATPRYLEPINGTIHLVFSSPELSMTHARILCFKKVLHKSYPYTHDGEQDRGQKPAAHVGFGANERKQ
jgi:hypothetical protein